MHGAGNDYVFVDGFTTGLPNEPDKTAVQVSNRNFGIGSDGLILMVPPTDSSHDVQMRMWNADGSVGEMCGNGVRCVALWMWLQNRVRGSCRIKTGSRVVDARVLQVADDCCNGTVVVDMGRVESNSDSEDSFLSDICLSVSGETSLAIQYTSVSVGNAHAVVFDQELSDHNVHYVGRLIQCHDHFPDSVNVEWVQVDSATELTVRVLERGSGETLACGSGACAAAVAAVLRGVCDRDTDIGVNLPGGRLTVLWRSSGQILLSGPASVSFSGEWLEDG